MSSVRLTYVKYALLTSSEHKENAFICYLVQFVPVSVLA